MGEWICFTLLIITWSYIFYIANKKKITGWKNTTIMIFGIYLLILLGPISFLCNNIESFYPTATYKIETNIFSLESNDFIIKVDDKQFYFFVNNNEHLHLASIKHEKINMEKSNSESPKIIVNFINHPTWLKVVAFPLLIDNVISIKNAPVIIVPENVKFI